MIKIAILGASGSIGKSTIEIVREFKENFKIVAVTGYKNIDKIKNIVDEFDIDLWTCNEKKICQLIKDCDADVFVNGIAGSAGLLPSFEIIKKGKRLALANKETIVMAGELLLKEAKKYNAEVIPVDSEHAAIFELSKIAKDEDLESITITASGGAFKDREIETFNSITIKDALKHPTWSMGNKITIDSATMANKGLEVIEAKVLFNIPLDKIKVLIHPQSRIHSIITTKEGSAYAQFSEPTMKIPILNALSYPRKFKTNYKKTNFITDNFSFEEVDYKKYPILKLAYSAAKNGINKRIAFNASNEVAVDLFLKEKIKYLDIYKIIEFTLENVPNLSVSCIEDILKVDSTSRDIAKKYYENMEL